MDGMVALLPLNASLWWLAIWSSFAYLVKVRKSWNARSCLDEVSIMKLLACILRKHMAYLHHVQWWARLPICVHVEHTTRMCFLCAKVHMAYSATQRDVQWIETNWPPPPKCVSHKPALRESTTQSVWARQLLYAITGEMRTIRNWHILPFTNPNMKVCPSPPHKPWTECPTQGWKPRT